MRLYFLIFSMGLWYKWHRTFLTWQLPRVWKRKKLNVHKREQEENEETHQCQGVALTLIPQTLTGTVGEHYDSQCKQMVLWGLIKNNIRPKMWSCDKPEGGLFLSRRWFYSHHDQFWLVTKHKLMTSCMG